MAGEVELDGLLAKLDDSNQGILCRITYYPIFSLISHFRP